MKNTIFNAMVAASFLAVSLMYQGCMKNEITPTEPQTECGTVPVSVMVPPPQDAVSPASKVTSVDDEKTIGTVQVYAFRQDGILDAYTKGAGTNLSINCTTGQKTFVALVNGPDVTDVTAMSELYAKTSLLGDNAPGALVMIGEESKAISATANSVTVNVKRLVARVGIEKITNSLAAAQYASTPIKVKSVYLANAAGDCLYSGSQAPTVWLNKMEESSDLPELLSSGNLDASVPSKGSYTTAHYFYCYSNPTAEDNSDETWSARYTRLVVCAEILGNTYYYPINIPNVTANHTYTITDLTITRLGSDSPDVPVTTDAVSVTITIADWVTGMSTIVTI